MDPQTEAALVGHVVVFLDVAIADASKRIGFDRSRPLLTVNPRASWVAMMNARRATYERVATTGSTRRVVTPSTSRRRSPVCSRACRRDPPGATDRDLGSVTTTTSSSARASSGRMPDLLAPGRRARARRPSTDAGQPWRGRWPTRSPTRGMPLSSPRCPTPSPRRRPRSPTLSGVGSGERASRGATRSSASVGERSPTSRASSGRRGCEVSRSFRSRPPCSAWSTRRSAARRASTPPRARTSSAPSIHRLVCSATPTCWRPCPRPTSSADWRRSSSAASSPTR